MTFILSTAFADAMVSGPEDVGRRSQCGLSSCLPVFGVFAGKEDDDSRVRAVSLALAVLFLVVEFVLIARVNESVCFTPRVEAASVGNGPWGDGNA